MSGWYLVVSLGVLMVYDGVCGCLDGIRLYMWVSDLCLKVSVSVSMVSDGVCV